MEEKVFFENGNVKVTNARFVVGDQTFAMAAVNSVKVSSTDITPSNAISGILVAVGGYLVFQGALWGQRIQFVHLAGRNNGRWLLLVSLH
jgi:hypothetical protein